MTQERAPERTQSLMGDEAETSSWELARTRLANPEQSRTCWLAFCRRWISRKRQTPSMCGWTCPA